MCACVEKSKELVVSAARCEPHHNMIDFSCRGVKQEADAVVPVESKHRILSKPSSKTASDGSGQAASAASEQDHSGCRSTHAESEADQSTSGGDGRLPCKGQLQQAAPALPERHLHSSSSSSSITDAVAVPAEAAAMDDMLPEEPQAGQAQLLEPTSPAKTTGTAACTPAAAVFGRPTATEAGDQLASSSQQAPPCESVMPAATMPITFPAATIQASSASRRLTEGMKSAQRPHGQQAGPAAAKPTQTAAEMLSWLDATLAAKKPFLGKAAVMTPPCILKVSQTDSLT